MPAINIVRATIFSLAIAGANPVAADEGLWTFDAFPADRVKAAYGADISQGWLNNVMRSSVRLSGGCSASLVSGRGLVLTNNHCVSSCAQDISTAQENYYEQGYVAVAGRVEKRCPMSAEVVTSITDVTARIVEAGRGLTGPALAAARREAKARVASAGCAGDRRSVCEVADMYGGGRYTLYKYRRYDDVRLVFSPGVAAQGLSGGPSPGFFFDGAMLRLYEDGKPSATPNHLRWNRTAPAAGELFFLAGHPRISERLLTVAQLKTKRETAIPLKLIQAAEQIGRLYRFGQESAANKQASQYQLWDMQNHQGYVLELMKALNTESFFAKKVAEEAELRARAGPAAQAPWSEIERAEEMRRSQSPAYDILVQGPSSELFSHARILVRSAAERLKPSAERLPPYSDDQLPSRQAAVFKEQAIYLPFEQVQLEFWLDAARRSLGNDEEKLEIVLGRDDPETLAGRLAQSKLGNAALRRRLWEGGWPAIMASDDPMIRYVLRTDPAARAVRAKWQASVIEPEERAAAQIAATRFSVYGTNGYPDANRTLRLSYGRVAGVTEGDRTEPFTTIGGMFQRASGNTPYKLDPRWLAAKEKLNMTTVLNISTTNDGINGNSGSPLVNGRGEIVGAFWGGNDAAMGGNYGYDAYQNRAVAVSTAAISEVLVKIYGGEAILKELTKSSK